MTERGLNLLVSTPPSEYFSFNEETNSLVLTGLWEALVAAQLLDANVERHENTVLDQLLDVFDAGTLNGIPGLVLDTFLEASPDAMVAHCGITAAECVLKWVARTVEECGAELDSGNGDPGVLRRNLTRSEAAREASEYALSWQDMGRSFHQIKSGQEGPSSAVSGPMSRSVMQNFKELAGVAAGISVVLKCMLVMAEAGDGNGSRSEAMNIDNRLARCGNTEGTLFAGLLKRYGFKESLEGKCAEESAMAFAMHYMEGRKHGVQESDLLALLVYCLQLSAEDVVVTLAKYFPSSAEDLRVWALAPLLDASLMNDDDVPLHAALTAISSGTLDCRRMPMAYLLVLLKLGKSAQVLSLLYQKWIDPNNVEDVLGCIKILMHEELLIECYVHVKQYLRQLQETSLHAHGHINQQSYQKKAKIFWQAMFSTGAECGMLFQLIRLPIAVKDEERHVVEWLRNGGDDDGRTHVDIKTVNERRKALCLYYLIRGRAEEATRELSAVELDPESDWDSYLGQLCVLAKKFTLVQEDSEGEFVRRNDAGEALPGTAPTGGVLFGAPPQSMEMDAVDENRSRSEAAWSTWQGGVFKPATPGQLQAHAQEQDQAPEQRQGVRGRVTRSLRANSKVHQLDRMLGL